MPRNCVVVSSDDITDQKNDAQMLYAECSSGSCYPDTYPIIFVLQQQLLPVRARAIDILEKQLFVWKHNGS